ncbi:MAG: prolyl oligopeptidase family serine peptidase [Fimbriimonas sp.]
MLSLITAFWLNAAFEPIQLTEGMSITRVTEGGRIPAPKDPVVAELIATTSYNPANSKLAWKPAKANVSGLFEGLTGGYLWTTFNAPAERVYVLEAEGHGMVYINNEPRAGDLYRTNWLKQPFKAVAGLNTLLFAGGRGQMTAKLVEPRAPQQLDTGDLTLPDMLKTDRGSLFGGIVVLNNTEQTIADLKVTAVAGGKTLSISAPTLPPLSSRKVRFDFPVTEDTTVDVKLMRGSQTIDTTTVTVAIKEPGQHYKRTFISAIDGSVQYFGVAPALKPSKDNALVLTLHGASVEGIGQAQAYAPKDWATIVSATNRRPYGFDWEDWGRLDALEVLGIAESMFPHDPQRVFLTGHSMGGHGTWHVGTMFPDRFGAIAPSAGWISFWSYAGGWQPREPNEVEKLLRTAMNPSDTLQRIRNLKDRGVYILHGDQDDNVPVGQARTGRAALRPWHRDLQYHEQPGAGHWWGNECVDWPGIFDMFNTRKRDLDPDNIEFITQNPGISGRNAWATIEQAMNQGAPSSIKLMRSSPAWTRVNVAGTTENVECLTLRILPNTTIVLDGQRLGPFEASTVTLKKHPGSWRLMNSDELKKQKNAGRAGPFKQAFQNRMIFVYGTAGTPEEDAWAYAKARFDAESFYYRGNGSIDIVPDTVAANMPLNDRNVIVYGNKETNGMWSRLLGNSPIQVDRRGINVGSKRFDGPELGTMFLRPRGKGTQLIGVVAGTGLVGSRVLDRLPVFVSGVAYSDWIVVSPAAITEGTKGILGAGNFANDWRLGTEAWR